MSSADLSGIPVIERPATVARAGQQQSRLMRLPAELRLPILRELLVAEQPLDRRSEYHVASIEHRQRAGGTWYTRQEFTFTNGYRLSPQVLSTCQTLLNEGFSILYKENILVLSIHVHGFTECHYRRQQCNGCIASEALQKCAAMWRVGGWVSYNDSTLNRFEQFANMDLYIDDYWHASTFRCVVRCLDSIVAGKSLQILITFGNKITDDQRRSLIRTFQLVRCKSFDISSDTTDKTIEEVKAVVKSSGPVQDLGLLYDEVEGCYEMLRMSNSAVPEMRLLLRDMVTDVQDFRTKGLP